MTNFIDGRLDVLATCQMYFWIGYPMEGEQQFRDAEAKTDEARQYAIMSLVARDIMSRSDKT